MHQNPWTPFFLETNKYFGPVCSLEDWERLLGMHSTIEDDVSVLTQAKEMPESEGIYGMPKFDLKPFIFDADAESARTRLYDWAKDKGMNLAA